MNQYNILIVIVLGGFNWFETRYCTNGIVCFSSFYKTFAYMQYFPYEILTFQLTTVGLIFQQWKKVKEIEKWINKKCITISILLTSILYTWKYHMCGGVKE